MLIYYTYTYNYIIFFFIATYIEKQHFHFQYFNVKAQHGAYTLHVFLSRMSFADDCTFN